MPYARIGMARITRGTFDEVAALVKDGLAPTFKAQPGFQWYGLADVGEGDLFSISIWDTREQAEAAVEAAARWVKDNIADRADLHTNYVGEMPWMATK
jgi:hypothetical protein